VPEALTFTEPESEKALLSQTVPQAQSLTLPKEAAPSLTETKTGAVPSLGMPQALPLIAPKAVSEEFIPLTAPKAVSSFPSREAVPSFQSLQAVPSQAIEEASVEGTEEAKEVGLEVRGSFEPIFQRAENEDKANLLNGFRVYQAVPQKIARQVQRWIHCNTHQYIIGLKATHQP